MRHGLLCYSNRMSGNARNYSYDRDSEGMEDAASATPRTPVASIVIIFRIYVCKYVRPHSSLIEEKRLIELYNVPDERLALF